MVVDKLLDWLSVNDNDLPNKFSIAMGRQIRQAREDIGWTQGQLAEATQRRRPSISEMENGKMVPDAITLFIMALSMKKPLEYFVGSHYRGQLDRGKITAQDRELLSYFHQIEDETQRQIAINQIKSLAEFNTKQASGE